MNRKNHISGFTLIELLTVISVIAVLMTISLPVLKRSRESGRRIVCLSRQRQMAVSANAYTVENNGYFPLAHWSDSQEGVIREWDFCKLSDTGDIQIEPGFLWQEGDSQEIQQCPAFKGNSNSPGDPYTGYNYNASYIGGYVTRSLGGGWVEIRSSRVYEVKNPSQCAIFGDGQYRQGANKYMRSPWPGKFAGSFTGRYAGTQGFRHAGKTNVVFCDGSGRSFNTPYRETESVHIPNIAESTGFLSEDNSLYDLE